MAAPGTLSPNAGDMRSCCDHSPAFHILNQFDIPKGAARGIEQGQEVADYTLWTSAADLKNRRYYFRTFDNSRIRMVDLKAMDLDAKEIKTISMKGEEVIEDVSGKAK